MNNLKQAIKRKYKENRKKFIEGLKEETQISDILSKWIYNDLIPISSKNKDWNSKRELTDYLLKRYNKNENKSLDQKLNKVDTIKNSKAIDSITITIEWKKSRTWGSNPRAEAQVNYKDNYSDRFYSSSIGGCGYDKESTALAQVLNQVNGLLKLLYKAKNKATDKRNSDLIGYGSGYGILPSLEGGVGVSCYYGIMKHIGLKFEHIVNGKTFDVYKISK